ncbi:MAG: hypothetical protein ACI9J2_000953 [Saprospiraceae bacterium]|jgi:hypothetical protein
MALFNKRKAHSLLAQEVASFTDQTLRDKPTAFSNLVWKALLLIV